MVLYGQGLHDQVPAVPSKKKPMGHTSTAEGTKVLLLVTGTAEPVGSVPAVVVASL